jgi:hypothetical protein
MNGITSNEKSPIREGYEIEVLDQRGYNLLVEFYFEKKGKTESIDKLDKKSLGSIRKFCERWAKKNNEKIISPFLNYKPTLKVVAKQTVLNKIFNDKHTF